jgi:mRNA-degrading endonuclease RelE of RelBE toxin-antitoxin system
LAWRIEYDSQVLRDFKKLDRTICKEIIGYLERRIAASENPRNFGKRFGKTNLVSGVIECATTESFARLKTEIA